MRTVMHMIFKKLNEEGISYCHFKSNQHLKESFEGISDFDVLVDKTKKQQITSILVELNGKRFESPYINNYPGIENWLVFDSNTGIIYHLHLHYQLLTGTRHVKEYLIKWYPLLLETAIYNTEYEIYTSNPEMEFILLLTRNVLKSVFEDVIKARFNRYHLSKDMQAEFDYLRDRSSRDKLVNALKEVFSTDIGNIILKCFDDGQLNSKQFLNLNKQIRKELCLYKRYRNVYTFFKCKKEDLISVSAKFRKRCGGFAIAKKVGQAGGIAIAFVGIDGSGKSTVSKEINKWMSNKIECQSLYLGTGDGVRNIWIIFLKKILSFGANFAGIKQGNSEESISSGKQIAKISLVHKPIHYIAYILKAMVIVCVVRENRKKLIQMNHYRISGGNCVMDRFPQLEKENINDGRKLPSYVQKLSGRAIKRMEKRESDCMEIINVIKPDVIFRLNISLETCLQRKPEHTNREYFLEKIENMQSITYDGINVVEINAEQPYEQEILEIKRYIWKLL